MGAFNKQEWQSLTDRVLAKWPQLQPAINNFSQNFPVEETHYLQIPEYQKAFKALEIFIDNAEIIKQSDLRESIEEHFSHYMDNLLPLLEILNPASLTLRSQYVRYGQEDAYRDVLSKQLEEGMRGAGMRAEKDKNPCRRGNS